MSKATIQGYFCGGAGINQGKYFLGLPPAEIGYADLAVTLVDTSASNLSGLNIDEDAIYRLPVDGSGKVRKENHGDIANTVKDVLVKHKPTQLNIVVYSASGGSGSVYGPLIQAELMERGLAVIAIVIGSDGTAIEAMNTVNTLKSLDNIARKKDVPAIVSFERNSKKNPRSTVDNAVRATINSLLLLGSQQNDELDTMDVTNWLRYSKVTTVPAQLALMEIVTTEQDAASIVDPISVASILDIGADAVIDFTPDYGTVGYKPANVMTENPEIHFVISINSVPELYTIVNGQAEHFAEVKASRPTQTSLVGKNDTTTSDDLIL